MSVPGVGWLAITEADVRGYAAMYLTSPSPVWGDHSLLAVLSPSISEAGICVTGNLPKHSAWRVMIVGDEPGSLIESNVITSLNPPSAIKDTSWIKAGRASWPSWNGSIGASGKSERTTENMKYYTDFAARNGFEYLLQDGGRSARDNILTGISILPSRPPASILPIAFVGAVFHRFSSFLSRATPAGHEGASPASSGYRKTRTCLISSDFAYTSQSPPSFDLFACPGLRRSLSRRQRQRLDSPHHASKQTARQMALCHQ
jgi:hypothetical protein